MNRFIAKGMDDLVTPRQLVAIRSIANRRRFDETELCKRVRGCRPEELSKKAASTFIAFLESESAVVVQGVINDQKKLNATASDPAA